jgi:hypothetical protein
MSQEPTPSPDLGPEEEVVHYDDATLGRAFRWSLVVFAVLGVA